MAALTQSLIQDCEAVGVSKISEEQAQKMLGQWDKKRSAAKAVDNKESEGYQNENSESQGHNV